MKIIESSLATAKVPKRYFSSIHQGSLVSATAASSAPTFSATISAILAKDELFLHPPTVMTRVLPFIFFTVTGGRYPVFFFYMGGCKLLVKRASGEQITSVTAENRATNARPRCEY
jgi:hypothetical protein